MKLYTVTVEFDYVVAAESEDEAENVARPDIVLPSLSPEDALSGAPAQEDSRFRVPQILGEAE